MTIVYQVNLKGDKERGKKDVEEERRKSVLEATFATSISFLHISVCTFYSQLKLAKKLTISLDAERWLRNVRKVVMQKGMMMLLCEKQVTALLVYFAAGNSP